MKKYLSLLLMLSLLFSIPAHAQEGGIYLYGETHGVQKILDRELALWQEYYENGARHLFVELPYYTAQLLNRWLKTGDGEIFAQVYADWEGSASHTSSVYLFYQSLAASCPQTVFHGTDVGHQYKTTGERYLRLLESEGLEESDDYARTLEAIEQGKHYYESGDDDYREYKMAENFLRAYEGLEDETVMGIYGSAHTTLDAKAYQGSVKNMATQLKKTLGDALHCEDLSSLAREMDPLKTEFIRVGEKDYEASYFGMQDLSRVLPAYQSRAFWRLENAYDDFSCARTVNNVLPASNFPMNIAAEEVFVIDYTLADGSVQREYYRCDGDMWQGQITAIQIKVE